MLWVMKSAPALCNPLTAPLHLLAVPSSSPQSSAASHCPSIPTPAPLSHSPLHPHAIPSIPMLSPLSHTVPPSSHFPSIPKLSLHPHADLSVPPSPLSPLSDTVPFIPMLSPHSYTVPSISHPGYQNLLPHKHYSLHSLLHTVIPPAVSLHPYAVPSIPMLSIHPSIHPPIPMLSH